MKENLGIPDHTYDNKSSSVILGQKKNKTENCVQAELLSTLKTRSARRILPWKWWSKYKYVYVHINE